MRPQPRKQPPQKPVQPQQPPLGLLDFLPDFKLMDQRHHLSVLSTQALGKAIVLAFVPDASKPGCLASLKALAARWSALDALAHLFVITSQTPEANGRAASLNSLPFPLLADQQGQVAAGFAIAHNRPGGTDFLGSGAFSVVVADSNRRIRRIDRAVDDAGYADGLLGYLEGLGAQQEAAKEMTGFAPVLVVPDVLEPAFCEQLIATHAAENTPSGVMRDAGEGGAEVFDSDLKNRRDHFVADAALFNEIKWRIGRRVLPEIYKAFHYRITGVEEFKVVRYDAADGGYFRPHRDNNTLAGAHRRFAMTLNLNTGDYEGGYLRFPEYGPHLYRPQRGAAVLFSCSLLHEAMPVTVGSRYVLLSFLYGDDAKAAPVPAQTAQRAPRR
jgi:peroxiredoxin/predicted 2-oxoglutarate/Fe(II)-dependent dioxygenase YbiX